MRRQTKLNLHPVTHSIPICQKKKKIYYYEQMAENKHILSKVHAEVFGLNPQM